MKTKHLFLSCLISIATMLCSCQFSHSNVKDVFVELADSSQKRIGDSITLKDLNVYFDYGSGLELIDIADFQSTLKSNIKSPSQKYANLSFNKYTFQDEGEYTIEVTYNPDSNYLFPCSGTTSFIVDDKFVPATSLNLASDSISIFTESSESIDYIVRPLDTTSIVSFESSDTSIATVSQEGVVTGVNEGQCIVKASVDGLTRECLVTVSPYETVNYVFTNNQFKSDNGDWIFSEAGNIKQGGGISVSTETKLISPISYNNITKIEYLCPNSNNNLDSNSGEISTFIENELVGTCSINQSLTTSNPSYKINNKTGYVCLNIKPNESKKSDVLLKSISITYNMGPVYPTSISFKNDVSLHVNCQDKLTLSYSPMSANQRIIEWSSSNQDVLTIDRDGTIYAHSEGEAIVTAKAKTYDGYTSCSTTIKVDKVPVEEILLDEEEINIYETKSKAIRYNVLPEDATYKGVIFESSNSKIATVDSNGNVTGMVPGECVVTVKSIDDSTIVGKCKVIVQERPPVYANSMSYVMSDLTDNMYSNIDSAPSLNKTKFLVIPVWFKDSSSYISSREIVREDINKAFFGLPSETGWHSVKSFYEKESGGKLSLKGTVSDWYETYYKHDAFDYDSSLETRKTSPSTSQLVKEATNWYFSTYSDNRRNYDCDGDGYLDAVILIYGCPDVEAFRRKNPDGEHGDNLWAYTSWLGDKNNCNPNKPGPNSYLWASYDFMYSEKTAMSRTALTNYSGGNTKNALIDTHSYIHETGHIFGLEDYYDYSNNYYKTSYKPAGGFSMQDYNVGGHDPFSCLSLGWVDAYIPFENCVITLTPFQSSHQVILLSPSFNRYNSPFDEYLLLELYTPTGLNEFDTKYKYKDNYPTGVTETGIRLWHVDARLVSVANKYNFAYYPCECFNVPFKSNDFMTSNTRYTAKTTGYGSPCGAECSDFKLLQLIRNNPQETYSSSSFFSSSDLFTDGSTFSINNLSKQFVNSDRFNSGKRFEWSFSVSISGANENAVATISFNKE